MTFGYVAERRPKEKDPRDAQGHWEETSSP